MIRKIKQVLIGLLLLPALATPVYAEETALERFGNQAYDALDALVQSLTTPLFGPKDTECLARNIYYESAHQPTEGMVAVGLVTINRFQDERYPKSICGVVQQRTRIGQAIVCQFSWTCTSAKNRRPREDDPEWQKSLEIANELAVGGYPQWQKKYANSFHFHAIYINPGWKLKRIGRIGHHIFYH